MPAPGALVQGTITLTAEQWTATQATLQRLETRLNDQQRSQSRLRSNSCESRDSRHRDNNRPNALKPKAPDAYNGRSHKERYKFLRQCTEYFRFIRLNIDDPGSVAFAASFLRSNTAGHVWDSYQASLPPEHVVTWAKFKKTLRDDLGDEDTFIDKT